MFVLEILVETNNYIIINESLYDIVNDFVVEIKDYVITELLLVLQNIF